MSRTEANIELSLNNNPIEQILELKYHGSWFTSNMDLSKTIQQRTNLGYMTMTRLNNIWKDNSISLEQKIRQLTAIIQPTVLYGEKWWLLKIKDTRRLQAFEIKCLRRLCKNKIHK